MGILYLTMGVLIVSCVLAGALEWYVKNQKILVKSAAQLHSRHRKMSHKASLSEELEPILLRQSS